MMSGHGSLIEVPRHGEVVEFKPERHRLNMAAADYTIEEAKRIKDWPMLEEAADFKIEEECKFVAWWGATVQRPGGDRQSQHSPRTRLMLCPEAERLTGMRHQRVSDLARKLAQPDQYRRHLLGAAYRAAMLDDEHDHHDGDEWGTPVEIIEPVRAFYGGQIDCDPASNETAQKTVRAIQYFTKAQDGLKQEWRGNTFLNGPYSDMAPWANKLISEYEAGHASEAIALTNSATGTQWFGRLFAAAAVICFVSGRIKFLDANGCEAPNGPMFDQALFYFGPRAHEFAEHFLPVGPIADPTRYRGAARAAE